MTAALYKNYSLPLLATLAADDLGRFYSDRSAPIDSVNEMISRLRVAALPITPPSASNHVLDTLRLSTIGGRYASNEAMREFAGFTAERMVLATKAQSPDSEYKYLTQLCLNMADRGMAPAHHPSPAVGVLPQAPRL